MLVNPATVVGRGSGPAGTVRTVSVEAHVSAILGPPAARAEISFVGVEPMAVLRFGPSGDGTIRYVTEGMSRRPMTDPLAVRTDGGGPRAELVLAVRERVDGVLRALSVLAAMPAVDGVVVRPGSSFELGQPLWPGARFTAVLVADPWLPDLPMDPDPVRFLAVIPITANEQALKRAKGPRELEERWAALGIDVLDPTRADGAIPPRDVPD
jgi:hypothetical protein